jgi:hypothetical protein
MSNTAYLAAVSTMRSYPIYRNRNDMSSGQYMQYVHEWNTFERIWIEDSVLSTLGTGQRYAFTTNEEFQAYLRGQAAHIDVYDSNSPGRILGTIYVPSNTYAPSNQFVRLR